MAVVQRLVTLNDALCSSGGGGSSSGRGGGGGGGASHVTLLQLAAACTALVACIEIAVHLWVGRNVALRIGQASKLIFGFGQQALASRMAERRRQRGTWTAEDFNTFKWHIERQTKVVEGLMYVLPSAVAGEQLAAHAAVFAAAVAPPQALLTWLATVTNALMLSLDANPQGELALPPAWLLCNKAWQRCRQLPCSISNNTQPLLCPDPITECPCRAACLLQATRLWCA